MSARNCRTSPSGANRWSWGSGTAQGVPGELARTSPAASRPVSGARRRSSRAGHRQHGPGTPTTIRPPSGEFPRSQRTPGTSSLSFGRAIRSAWASRRRNLPGIEAEAPQLVGGHRHEPVRGAIVAVAAGGRVNSSATACSLPQERQPTILRGSTSSKTPKHPSSAVAGPKPCSSAAVSVQFGHSARRTIRSSTPLHAGRSAHSLIRPGRGPSGAGTSRRSSRSSSERSRRLQPCGSVNSTGTTLPRRWPGRGSSRTASFAFVIRPGSEKRSRAPNHCSDCLVHRARPLVGNLERDAVTLAAEFHAREHEPYRGDAVLGCRRKRLWPGQPREVEPPQPHRLQLRVGREKLLDEGRRHRRSMPVACVGNHVDGTRLGRVGQDEFHRRTHPATDQLALVELGRHSRKSLQVNPELKDALAPVPLRTRRAAREGPDVDRRSGAVVGAEGGLDARLEPLQPLTTGVGPAALRAKKAGPPASRAGVVVGEADLLGPPEEVVVPGEEPQRPLVRPCRRNEAAARLAPSGEASGLKATRPLPPTPAVGTWRDNCRRCATESQQFRWP